MKGRRFGDQLRLFRESHNAKLTWFATIAGVSPALLSTVERGQRALKVRTLAGVVRACVRTGAPADEVLALVGAGLSELSETRPREAGKWESGEHRDY